jgi:Domain of unknown function (DUF4160)
MRSTVGMGRLVLEGHEPPHIHIENGDRVAKFWLEPIALAASQGFRSHELNRLLRLAVAHRGEFERAWHEHFGAPA